MPTSLRGSLGLGVLAAMIMGLGHLGAQAPGAKPRGGAPAIPGPAASVPLYTSPLDLPAPQPMPPAVPGSGTGAGRGPAAVPATRPAPVTATRPAPVRGGPRTTEIPPVGGGIVAAAQPETKEPPAMPEKVGGGEGVLPPPREYMPFGPNRPRLPRLPGVPGPLGTAPEPSKKDLEEFGRFVDKFIDPRNTMTLIQGLTRLLVLKEAPKRIQIGDETIAAYNLITPKEITIVGRGVGNTVLNLWFTDPENKEKEKILSYLVRVIPDPGVKERLDRVYDALAGEVNKMFPDSVVHIKLLGDKLVVSGTVRDIHEGTMILRIIRANAPPTDQAKLPIDNVQLIVRPDDISAPGGLPGLDSFLLAGGPNVVNLLRVAGEQQVMLKVTVAEVNRSAARDIGLNFSITNNQGINVFRNSTGTINAGPIAGALGGAATANLPVLIDNGQISLAIRALKTLSFARTLAEPNLVAMNGQTANFQAGGQFPVPVLATGNFGGGNLQGVQFVPFGVQLNFTPYITDKDRIRLQVAANVSTRDLAAGANFGGGGGGIGGIGGGGGTNVPGLSTRNFTTVVELREGQTLAVAGLLQTNFGADSTRVPFFGDIPFLGQLTGLSRMSSGEQELVILITPELVHPMNPHEVPPLPGSDLFEPSDLEFYVAGRLEGRRHYDYRSQAMTSLDRMRRYHRAEQLYLYGPVGFHLEVPVPAPAMNLHLPTPGPMPRTVPGSGVPGMLPGTLPGTGLPSGSLPSGSLPISGLPTSGLSN